ncbi:MAG: MarR family winged helix-turn-helix transcriptional regulator [Streptosporangiaceae bacterium]
MALPTVPSARCARRCSCWTRRMRCQQAGDELSASEAAGLGRVGRMGPVTPMVLAHCEHVQPPVTCILERLTGRGLVLRNPDPADRRQVLISRTPAGHGLARHIRLSRTWLAGQRLAVLT